MGSVRLGAVALATLLGAAALLLGPVKAEEPGPLAGTWRSSGSDPVRGRFVGQVEGTPDGATWRRVFPGGEESFVVVARPSPGGGFEVEQVERGGGLASLGSTPTTTTRTLARATFRPVGQGFRGVWSPGGLEESLVRDEPLRGFLEVGHRGAPYEAPENTFEAFEAALKGGARGLEMDLCTTKDGEVVIWHDRAPGSMVALFRQLGLEGMPFKTWNPNLFTKYRRPTEELTLAELREHYGYQGTRRRKGKLSKGRIDVQIPRAVEVLRWLAEVPGLERVYLDTKLKDGDVAQAKLMAGVVAKLFRDDPLVRASGLDRRLVWMNIDKRLVEALRSGWGAPVPRSKGPHFGLDFDVGVDGDPFDLAASVRADTLLIGWSTRSERKFKQLVSTAQKKRQDAQRSGGHRVEELLAWTLDEPDEWKLALDLGCDSICTNRPRDLRTWRERRAPDALPVPPPPRSRDSVQTWDSGYVAKGGEVGGFVGGLVRGLMRGVSWLFGN